MQITSESIVPKLWPYIQNCRKLATTRKILQKNNLPLQEFLPEYDKYPPKQAPLIRNKQIAEACDCLIAFWDGQSKGTKYTIGYAVQMGKPVKVWNHITNEITFENAIWPHIGRIIPI